MNFSEKLAAYKNSSRPQPCLEPDTILSGGTVKEKLERLMEARKMSTRSPSFGLKGNGRDTVIICLVIVDKLHHEAIWRDWIEKGSTTGSHFRLLLHAKFRDRLESAWARKQALSEEKGFKPEWNSPEVVRAMLALLQEGLSDPRAARFVFGTESCLPIYPAADVYKALMREDVSWLAARHSAEDKFEAASCFGAVDSSIFPRSSVWKSLPGWVMLTWRHVHEIVSLCQCAGADLVRAMGPPGPWSELTGGVFAPEEVFFPTMLAVLGYLRDSGSAPSSSGAGAGAGAGVGSSNGDEVRRRMVTYAEWPRRGAANPVSFARLDSPLLERLRRTGSCFARKFGPDSCSLSEWIAVVDACSYKHEICGGPKESDSSVPTDEICRKLQEIWRKAREKPTASTAAALPLQDQLPNESPPPTAAVASRALRIAMLMIVVDDVPHEAIWREWARGADISTEEDLCSEPAGHPTVRFLIHAKEPSAISSEWVRNRLVKTFHLKPTWGSLELTDVMIRLLREALEADDSIDALCFCSDSCVPVVSLEEFQRAVSARPSDAQGGVRSWVRYEHEPTNGYAKQKQFDVLQGRVPAQCISKADQWLLLSRAHAKKVLELSNTQELGRPLLQSFRGVSASDEMYFPTCLSVLGIIPSSGDETKSTNGRLEVLRQQLTYCEWRSGDPSPRTFTDLTQADISRAQTEGSLLLRKLKSPHCSGSQRYGAAQYAQGQRLQYRADSAALQRETEWRADMLSKWTTLIKGGDSANGSVNSHQQKRPRI